MKDLFKQMENQKDDFFQQIAEMVKPKKQGGFFDLPKTDSNIGNCKSNEHNPPSHLHIPQGKGFKHICPACGKQTVIIPPQISF